MKKTPISPAIGDPGMVVNLYALERWRQQQHTVMTSNRISYEALLNEVHEKDIMVLSLTPFCNKWYNGNIQPHSGKHRYIMQLKDSVINMLRDAIEIRINLYTNLIPQRKNMYKRSMIHYQRLVSMINRMESILIAEWWKANSPELAFRREVDVCSTLLKYKVISGDWGEKTGWHASLSYISPSGQEITVTV